MIVGGDLVIDDDADEEGGEELDNENENPIHFARYSAPFFFALIHFASFVPLNINRYALKLIGNIGQKFNDPQLICRFD